MTKPKHVPECFNGRQRSGGLPCICDRLRACEQRVAQESYPLLFDKGVTAGLSAARDAVAALCDCVHLNGKHASSCAIQDAVAALAAIDALRGES